MAKKQNTSRLPTDLGEFNEILKWETERAPAGFTPDQLARAVTRTILEDYEMPRRLKKALVRRGVECLVITGLLMQLEPT